MKHSRITRKTWIKRGSKPLKRKPLARKVPKADPIMAAYAKAFPSCERCGRKPRDGHHIFRGAFRRSVWGNLLSLCRACHEWVESMAIAGVVWCLAVKNRKGEFDVAALSEGIGRDVAAWLTLDKVIAACVGRYAEMRLDLLEAC